MTPGERALWLAVFAASWHQSTGGPMGRVSDESRALFCMAQADRAVNAARRVDRALGDFAVEVLGG
jgi:hypothetical protein